MNRLVLPFLVCSLSQFLAVDIDCSQMEGYRSTEAMFSCNFKLVFKSRSITCVTECTTEKFLSVVSSSHMYTKFACKLISCYGNGCANPISTLPVTISSASGSRFKSAMSLSALS